MKEIQTNPNKDEIIKANCRKCKNYTNHKIVQSTQVYEKWPMTNSDEEYWNDDSYEIISCLGCETFSFRHHHVNSEDHDMDGFISTIKFYPKRQYDHIDAKHYYPAPKTIQNIYKETIQCYNQQSIILAAAGVRAIVECICNVYKITDGPVVGKDGQTRRKNNLQGKINGLAESGHLTESDSIILHELRFLGNDAIHEIEVPNKQSIKYAIEIIENVLNSLYMNPQKQRMIENKRKWG